MAGNMYNPEHITLEGFKVVQGSTFNNRFKSRGISVSLYPNKFRFSKDCVMALGNCEYVIMMQNKETRQLLIRGANSSEENSFKWFSPQSGNSLEKQNPELMEGIYSIMGWNKDKKYNVDGRIALAGNLPVLLFDLSVSIPEEYRQIKNSAEAPTYPSNQGITNTMESRM